MRSKLFVPGSRPELFDKALAGAADAVSFDLEDSVDPARKGEARDALRALLQGPRPAASGKTIIVRVNAPDTPWFAEDVAALALPGVHLLNVPKLQSRADVLDAVGAIEAAERANAAERSSPSPTSPTAPKAEMAPTAATAPTAAIAETVPTAASPVGLLANIETPRALRLAHEIATAHPRVQGLQLGLGDLFEPLQISRRDTAAVHAAMLSVRLAAGEAGIWVCDGAWADFSDADGFRTEAAMARQLGYVGKSCIHPRQIELANEIFRPTAAEIADARKVAAAASRASEAGVGAWVVDGRMVDAPFVRRALATLQTARRLGIDVD